MQLWGLKREAQRRRKLCALVVGDVVVMVRVGRSRPLVMAIFGASGAPSGVLRFTRGHGQVYIVKSRDSSLSRSTELGT